MIRIGKWHIVPDEEQWMMFDKIIQRKDGRTEFGGNKYYYGSVESLLRGLVQQLTRDRSGDSKNLVEMLSIYRQTAEEVKEVVRLALESLSSPTA